MKTTQEKIEVMQAAARGETIEFRPRGGPILNTWADAKENPNWDWHNLDYRVKPAPASKIASGHNPLNFTEEVVEVDMGWRLLDADEIKPRKRSIEDTNLIEKFTPLYGWEQRWHGNLPGFTYRTKLTREQLAKYDLPSRIVKKRVPCTAADFPPGTILRHESWRPTTWTAVIFVGAEKIRYCTNEHGQGERSYVSMVDTEFSRSLDGGKTWLACYRLIEEVTEG